MINTTTRPSDPRFAERVYVDELMTCAPNELWRHRQACHMFVAVGTPLDVLHEFALLIGLKRAWFQDARLPHYDLTARKRAAALSAGAIAIDPADAVRVFESWRALRGQRFPPQGVVE